MRITRFGFLLAIPGSLALAVPAPAQIPSLIAPALSYADLADLSLPAPAVAQVRIASASRLKPAEAPGLQPSRTRFYVQADIVTLIRGPSSLPVRVAFLADLPNLADGNAPKLRKGEERLIFAQTVAGRPSELRLIGPGGMITATPTDVARLRTILREAADARAAPRIVGVGKSFHVPGSLPGESETQIFLLTADNRPVSLNILRRPGEGPRWSAALAEIVDEAAAAPARDTLLWYRLACGLPRELPPQSLAEIGGAEAAAVRTDYRFVLTQLGRCGRTRAGR